MCSKLLCTNLLESKFKLHLRVDELSKKERFIFFLARHYQLSTNLTKDKAKITNSTPNKKFVKLLRCKI